MSIRMWMVLVAIVSLSAVPAGAQTHLFTFESGLDGWTCDFADYPVTDSLFYELSWGHAALPWPLSTADSTIRISGNNHSDDLFMFLKKRITGLTPHHAYRVTITVDVASRYPTNAAGVGGAPGEGVVFKAGAVMDEPMKVQDGGNYRMNIDKGDQSQRGADMDTIGHAGVTDTTTAYTMIRRTNAAHPCTVTADASGAVWICIGTDSGFEATTTLYFDRITVIFDAATDVKDPRGLPADHRLGYNYPNPFNPLTMIPIDLAADEHVDLRVYDMIGREVAVLIDGMMAAGRRDVPFNATGLASGVYIYRMSAGRVQLARTMVMVR
ncbi:MAG: T9SS type A sorting domain-containing protein [Ignavibacteriae bacterium]|nr:T9SS type A sorting domain-containing protein [Ignavibacteriota bacterium]